VAAIAKVCADHGLPLYLDGARIFNACTAPAWLSPSYATHGGRDDVLPVQGPRRTDRLDAGG
jgi:threonine aldolase